LREHGLPAGLNIKPTELLAKAALNFPVIAGAKLLEKLRTKQITEQDFWAEYAKLTAPGASKQEARQAAVADEVTGIAEIERNFDEY